jgi:hypothetical protein
VVEPEAILTELTDAPPDVWEKTAPVLLDANVTLAPPLTADALPKLSWD